MDDLEHRRRRLYRAWWLIRLELAIAIGIPLVAGLLFMAAPPTSSGMYGDEPARIDLRVACGGVAMYLVGLVWMIRLSRANPEGGERSWRYRDF
jgi:hypothetical protein